MTNNAQSVSTNKTPIISSFSMKPDSLSLNSSLTPPSPAVHLPMKRTVDAMSEAYDDLLKAVMDFHSQQTSSAGQRTPESDTAIQNVREKLESFKEKCNIAEDFVSTARRNLAADLAASAAGVGGGEVKNDSDAGDSASDNTSAVSKPSPPDTSGSRVSGD